MGHKYNGHEHSEAVLVTIVPTATDLLDTTDIAVPLPRYAQLIRYSECEFFGVNFNTDPTDLCGTIWTKPQRDMVARYLMEAQEEIEQEVNFPLVVRWIEDDEQDYSESVLARWGRVIEAGVRGETTIEAGSAVAHATDPAVVGPVATTVTDVDEIRVFHPGTDIEIHPSSVTISGGNVTVEIPRCRLVTEAAADNPSNGLDYTDLSNFESTVDVKRIYNDASENATLVWPAGTTSCCSSCSSTTRDACMVIVDGEIGRILAQLATYSSGSWSRSTLSACFCCAPERVRLNYRAGLDPTTRQAEDAVIRLAHSKMPQAPCGCDVASRVWKRDRNIPSVLTAERINCPFGLSDGAWIAWRFAQSMKLVRGSTF